MFSRCVNGLAGTVVGDETKGVAMKPMGIALVGIGPGAVPHLLSLNDLRAEVICAGPSPADPKPPRWDLFKVTYNPAAIFKPCWATRMCKR
jgi:hypothetical protein